MVRNIRTAYYGYLVNRAILQTLAYQDSIYKNFVARAQLRLRTGESSNLELISARNKFQEIRALKIAVEADLRNHELAFQQLLNTTDSIRPADGNYVLSWASIHTDANLASNTQVAYELQNTKVADAKVLVEKAKLLPEFTLGYSQQLVMSALNLGGIDRTYASNTRMAGLQVGVSVPLFYGASKAKIKSEKIGSQLARANYQAVQSQLQVQYHQQVQQYTKYEQSVNYYTSVGLKLADEELRIAQLAFNLGEIGYMEYIQHVSAAVQSKLTYYDAVNRLNQSVIQLQFLKKE